MKLPKTLACLLLIVGSTHLYASGAIYESQWKIDVPVDGAYRFFPLNAGNALPPLPNTPYYIKSITALVWANCMVETILYSGVLRNSDSATALYFDWDLQEGTEGQGPGGTQITKTFSPDYLEIDPPDALKLGISATGNGGYPVAVIIFIWYTLIP